MCAKSKICHVFFPPCADGGGEATTPAIAGLMPAWKCLVLQTRFCSFLCLKPNFGALNATPPPPSPHLPPIVGTEGETSAARRGGRASRNPMTVFDFEVDSWRLRVQQLHSRPRVTWPDVAWTGFAEKKKQKKTTYPYLQVYRARKKKKKLFFWRTKLVGTEKFIKEQKPLKSMTRWNEGILRFANAVRLSDLFCIIL